MSDDRSRSASWPSPKPLNPGASTFSLQPASILGSVLAPDMFRDWCSSEVFCKIWSGRETPESRTSSIDLNRDFEATRVERSSTNTALASPTVQAVISNVLDDDQHSSSPSPPPEIGTLSLEDARVISPRSALRQQQWSPQTAAMSPARTAPNLVLSTPIRPRPLSSNSRPIWSEQRMGSNGQSAFSPCLRSANLKGTTFDDAFFVPVRDQLRSPPPPRIKSPSLQHFFDIEVVSGTVPVEFSNEHCAFCLRNDRIDDSLLELHCRRLGCVHVVHADCMAMESSQALLLRNHSAQYVHAHAPMSITPTPPPYSALFTNRQFFVEINILHVVSNVQQAAFRSALPMRSFVNPRSGVEHLTVSYPKQPLLIFHIPRGSIKCKCHLAGSGQVWEFSSNYNMTSHPPDAPAELVLFSASSESSLTLLLESTSTYENSFGWTLRSATFELLGTAVVAPSPQSTLRNISPYDGSESELYSHGRVSHDRLQPLPFFSRSIEFSRDAEMLRPFSRGGRDNLTSPPLSTRSAPGFASPIDLSSFHCDKSGDQLLTRVVGHIPELAKTQCGSRFLQDRIREGDERYISLIFEEAFNDLRALMTDLFGNYLCQRLISKCTHEQRHQLLVCLAPCIVDVSCDRQGTRVMQKLIQYTTTEEQRKVLIDALSPDIIQLMKDPHGSYVVNAMLEHIPLKNLSFIPDAARKNCHSLAVNQHGLCVLKKCLSLVDQPTFDNLVDKIMEHVLEFVNNKYGNYMIQHVLAVGREKAGHVLHERLRGHYCVLSRQKFSSNVVEKCLTVVDERCRAEIIAEFTVDHENIALLLQDSYGNYVMQNALSVSDGSQSLLLTSLIRPLLKTLRKNIQKKWERLLKSAALGPGRASSRVDDARTN